MNLGKRHPAMPAVSSTRWFGSWGIAGSEELPGSKDKAAKKLAKQMMFANESYSGLVAKEFAHAIRLSDRTIFNPQPTL